MRGQSKGFVAKMWRGTRTFRVATMQWSVLEVRFSQDNTPRFFSAWSGLMHYVSMGALPLHARRSSRMIESRSTSRGLL